MVYSAATGVAYYIGADYRRGYEQAGGPGGFLGLPTQHSTEAAVPPAYYMDFNSNFTGAPIQQFQHGFVGYNSVSGMWEGALHYPLACDVRVSVIEERQKIEPTPDNPHPNPDYVRKRRMTISVGGIADPGNPSGGESFGEVWLGASNETTHDDFLASMAPEGDHVLYELPQLFDLDDTITFIAEAHRRSDDRIGLAPQTWQLDNIPYTVPAGFGNFVLSSCDHSTLPGGGGSYVPPPDTTPPVIEAPTLFQDGAGNLSVRAKVTDNRAVAWVKLTIDGHEQTMLPRGSDSYEALVYGLALGTHRLFITAADTSGNTARYPSGNQDIIVKLEMSGFYGKPAFVGYSVDPVNTLIGNYIYQYTDLKLQTPRQNLTLERFYNGQSSAVGLFGLGWSTLFDTRLTVVDNLLLDGVQLRYPDGRTVNFPAQGDGFGHASTVFDTLAHEGSGYLLTRTDQTHFHFDDHGRLIRVEDPSANAIELTYQGNQLAQIRAAGRTITLTSDASGRVTSLSAPGNITLTYAYDADGRLTSVTDATGATVHYRYEAEHGLVGLQTPQGHDFLTEQRFDDQGRVLYQRVGDNFVNRFSYDDATRTTTIADTYGHTTTYRYDEKGRVIAQLDALGHAETFTYNTDNLRTSLTDRNGHTTTYEYNAQGDKVKETNPLGGVRSWTYDDQHHLTSETDVLGHTTRYEYDDHGRRTAEIDPLGQRTTMRYDDHGRLIEQTDPRGGSTTYTYDDQGNMVAERDPLGGVARHEYDALGRRTRTTDANGHATTFTYDANGNLLTQTDALGHITTYEYDANNNRVSETDANGHTARYSYSHLDTLLATTAPDGGVTSITYDDLNHRIAETDPLGHTTRFTLDADYRVISQTDALGFTTGYTYDAAGNRASTTDPRGFTTRSEYDALNRLVATIDPLGGTIRTEYDAAGNRVRETNANGATTSYAYDALNRLISQTDALGFTTTYAYDAAGNRTSTTDPNRATTRSEYDALSRRVRETDALGNLTRSEYDAVGSTLAVTDALGFATRYAYDAANHRVAETDALGHTTRYAYDAVGNQTAVTDALGNTTRYEYDSLNRRVRVVDALGGQELTAYDRAGRRTSTTNANGHTTAYAYDALGRTLVVTDALGFTTRSAYDAVGNLVAEQDQNGALTRSEYDALNRRVSTTNALGFATRFAYDAVGNLVATTNALGATTTYDYDALNRRVTETNALKFSTRTEYDPLGRVIRTTFADGSVTMRAYDAAGHLLTETDAEGFNRRYAYDAVGNQTVLTDALGLMTTSTYDALRRPVSVRDSIGLISQTEYDAVGNVVAQTDGNGHTTRTSYDALRRPLAVTDPEGHLTRSAYDAVGNRTALTDGNGHTTRTSYDVRNQPIAVTDPLGHTTRTAYDGAGRPLAVTDPLGVVTANRYDAVGQLVAVTLNAKPGAMADAQTNVTTRYAYDAVGNRVSTTDPNGRTVTFRPDALGQLVAETDPLGNVTHYEYNAVGRQVKRIKPDGALISSEYDRNGLLVRTSASDGTVTRSYDGNRNLLMIADSSGTTRRTYDARSRLVSEETPRGRLAYGYDGANNRTSLTYADGRVVRSAYFTDNQLKSVTNPDGATTTYTRDGIGQVLRQENGNSTITTQQYDAANHLLTVETRQVGSGEHLLVRVSYQYDAAGQRSQATTEDRTGQPKTSSETYSQDALRRLIALRTSEGVQTRYVYDAAGNRIAWQSNDDPRTPKPFDALDLAYRYDAADELVRADDRANSLQTEYRYDPNGNRVEQRTGRAGKPLAAGLSYSYDSADRLTTVQNFQINGSGQRNDQRVATMAYDGEDRRVAKSEDHNLGGGGQQTTTYLYDGLDAIASYETWHPQHDNLYRADANRILTLDRQTGGNEGKSYWFSQDALGSTLALSQDKGQGAHSYDYDVFGAPIPDNGGTPSPHNPFTFTGQEYDDFIGLYHFHARSYDPATGTWLTRDPYRGTPDDPQSLHRYGYVKGNPVNLVDVYGYAACGTYGKCQPQPPRVPVADFFFALVKLATGQDLQADMDNMSLNAEFKPKDLYDLWKRMQTKTLFHRDLTPEVLRQVHALGKSFSIYASYEAEIGITSSADGPTVDVNLLNGEIDASIFSAQICAVASIRGEIGVNIPLNAVVRVDVYGALGAEFHGCITYKFLKDLKSDADMNVYGEIGGRVYAEIDAIIAGARVGARVSGRLQNELWSTEEHGASLNLEAAPFYGYKYWGRDWEDHDIFKFSANIPLVERK